MSAVENTPRLRIRDASLSSRISADLSDLLQFRHLIWYMAMSSLAVESRGTKLGRSWWIIEPILLMGVYTLLMRVIFHRGGPNFPLVVLAAILAFEFFARSVSRSMNMLVVAQSSMRHVAFPRTVIPLAVTISEAIRFVISVAAFIVIAAAFGILPKPVAVLVLPFMVIEFLFTLGSSYLFAATGIFFRDLTKITAYLFWILFQLAPGMYTLAMVPANVRHLLLYNPFTTFFEGLRAPLLYGRVPGISYTLLGSVTVLSVVLLISGYIYFLQREGSFTKVVF